jgi:hypothetical protein
MNSDVHAQFFSFYRPLSFLSLPRSTLTTRREEERKERVKVASFTDMHRHDHIAVVLFAC